MKHRHHRILIVFSLAAFAALAEAQTTAFTYQGSLNDGGTPANGSFQMQFKLFDSLAGAGQVGATISNVPVTVNEGVFSTRLDFGSNALSGANRWLEIAVRRNAGESYVALSPREQIASAPYSVRTLSAASADVALDSLKLGGLAASQYVTTASVGNAFIRNSAATQTGANFNIDGNGFVGGSFGVGTTAPSFKLDVFGTFRSFRAGDSNDVVVQSTGPINSWARFWMITPGRAWVLGTSRNFNGDQFYLNDETIGQSRFTIQPNGGAIAFPTGNVGIGTSAPNAKLAVEGESASGVGIATSGNVTQSLNKGGLIKAMVVLQEFIDPGQIVRCYNGVTGSSVVPCGFVATRIGPGDYRINFGFSTEQRFWSVSTRSVCTVGAGYAPVDGLFWVRTLLSGQLTDCGPSIIVY